jgi:ABC-type transport system involved in multi-copper enzyme maturation permease subunit
MFPDKLFAPAKRLDLMPDGANPVLDKELRSEIFSQGTLMLRVVIQLSMFLSIPLMAALLFLWSYMTPYYVAYVLTFNMLVGPVFSSGSVTQERERQTLSLLLTTLLTPGRIIIAKLLAALRVSTVLTFLLTEQLLLAYAFLYELRGRFWTLIVFLLIIGATCLATSSVGLMWSALCRRTSTAMVLTYMTLMALFLLPIGLVWYLQGMTREARFTPEQLAALTVTSPFSAALSVPMHLSRPDGITSQALTISTPPMVQLGERLYAPVWAIFLVLYPVLSAFFVAVACLAFRWRWWRAGNVV